MSDRMVVQSVGALDDRYGEALTITRPIHERYARACGADYQVVVGELEKGLCPAWNKARLLRLAFERGYRKVVWLDVDTLVVDLQVDIFAETDDTVALQMTPYLPFGDPASDQSGTWYFNTGVIVANASTAALDAMLFTWSHRHDVPATAAEASVWDQGPLNVWAGQHQGRHVLPLDSRFNWMYDWSPLGSGDAAVIHAWHGQGAAALPEMRDMAGCVTRGVPCPARRPLGA